LSFRNYNADLANVYLDFQDITVALAVLAKMSNYFLNIKLLIKLIPANVVKHHGLLNAKLFILYTGIFILFKGRIELVPQKRVSVLDAILLKAVQPIIEAAYKKHNN
jgi:hypothetical protein